MRFALMIEAQQGLTYEDQLVIARQAEAGGFEALFRSDHYASFPGSSGQVTTDAWVVLAGLARETSTIGLGTLVSPVTFRHPGNFAKLVTTVDHMSGGRLEVGVGAGWNDDDHLPLGLPFPSMDARADLLEDQLELLHGLWTEPDGWSYDGNQITVRNGSLQPRPVEVAGRPRGRDGRTPDGRARPRIITGGQGTPRGFRIAVRWSDEFNLTSSSASVAKAKMAELDDACRAAGRDPATLARSAMVGVLIGRDEGELRHRADEQRAAFGVSGGDADSWLDEHRARWIVGTPDEARATIRGYAEAGIERIMLQDMLPLDAGMIDLMAQEILGRV
ncbi:MAG TPA: LLM class flavin-dependent oxidoreductase [Candidatus Limnocylindria bacterium]|nr:LLM class flavin-dependent oxidoreductase [Candidatus Limnocylindria bacterium]